MEIQKNEHNFSLNNATNSLSKYQLKFESLNKLLESYTTKNNSSFVKLKVKK